MEDREKLVRDTIDWFLHTDRAVKSVGGYGADIVLKGMSDELLYTMIANGLFIESRKKNEQ